MLRTYLAVSGVDVCGIAILNKACNRGVVSFPLKANALTSKMRRLWRPTSSKPVTSPSILRTIVIGTACEVSHAVLLF